MHITIQQNRLRVRRSRSMLPACLLRAFLIVLLAFGTMSPGSLRAGSAEPEIVARVNGEALTRGQLRRVQVDLLTLRQLQPGSGANELGPGELERLALQKLIQRRLVLQEAARQNLSVSEDELDQAITVLRGRFDDLKSFGMWMQERGLDDRSLFETIRGDLLTKRVMEALVAGVVVTEEQMTEYYEAHQEEMIIGEEVRLRIIAVQSRTEAEEILTALREGQKFSRLARERSLGKLAARGGDTGWVDLQTLPQPLREVVGGLKEGDASGPVQKNADEFLIVGLQGRRPVHAKSLDEARPEIERRLLPAQSEEAVKAWLAEQEKNSKIEVFIHADPPEEGVDQPQDLRSQDKQGSRI